MTRRDLLRGLGLAALAGPVRRLAAQGGQPRDSAGSDRLYDPRMVQPRARATGADNAPEIKALEGRLKCTCGCNLDIYTCRTTDFTCTYSPELHREVLALQEAGKSPDEILAAFVAKYGEQVLMAPKPEGFNLTAYLVPGAAVLLAAGLITAVLTRRARRLAVAPASPAPPAPASPGEQELLRRALEDVEG
jgi:cytochrome c-type biogenesis protein CcmH